METRKNTYYKGCHTDYISGMPLPTRGKSKYVKSIHFVDCKFHPECDSALFRECHFTNCTGLQDLNMEKCYIIKNSASIGGIPLEIDDPIIVCGQVVDRLSHSKNNYMYLYRYCAIVELDKIRYWPAMDNVLVIRTIDND